MVGGSGRKKLRVVASLLPYDSTNPPLQRQTVHTPRLLN